MTSPGHFQFILPGKTIFGAGSFQQLGSIVRDFIVKTETQKPAVLIITGKSFAEREKERWNALLSVLDESGVQVDTASIINEPTPEDIDEITASFKEFSGKNSMTAVIAIGGGSVLDGGKAISAMLTKEQSVKEYLEGVGTLKHDGKKIPFIAIPTTAGTGSEATKNAVISYIDKNNGFKKSLRHDNFVPDVALLDPELTLSLPSDQTAASGMDAFTQLLESYTSTNANPLSDDLAFSGLKYLIPALLPVSTDQGNNVELRGNVLYGSYLSGITLANVGLGMVHGFASVLGAYYPVPHGVVCGTLMGACTELNIRKLIDSGENETALIKYARVGVLAWETNHPKERAPALNEGDKNQIEEYALYLGEFIQELTQKLNMPKLNNYGVSSNLEELSRLARESGEKFNPVSITEEEKIELLRKRL